MKKREIKRLMRQAKTEVTDLFFKWSFGGCVAGVVGAQCLYGLDADRMQMLFGGSLGLIAVNIMVTPFLIKIIKYNLKTSSEARTKLREYVQELADIPNKSSPIDLRYDEATGSYMRD